MTALFTPQQGPPVGPGFTLPTMIQTGGDGLHNVDRVNREPWEADLDLSDPQTWAWLALLSAASYLTDQAILARIAMLKIPGPVIGLVSSPTLAPLTSTVVKYERFSVVVSTGVQTSTEYGKWVSDFLLCRTAGGPAFTWQTPAQLGTEIASRLADEEPDGKPVVWVGHSQGGSANACAARAAVSHHPAGRLVTFGAPKTGNAAWQAQLAAGFSPLCFGADDDPVIGFPPARVPFSSIAQIAALWPTVPPAQQLIFAALNSCWGQMRSCSASHYLVSHDGGLAISGGVDDNGNWAARTSLTVFDLITWSGYNSFRSHGIRVYYERIRRMFGNWTTLTAAAGPGGEAMDVLALAVFARF